MVMPPELVDWVDADGSVHRCVRLAIDARALAELCVNGTTFAFLGEVDVVITVTDDDDHQTLTNVLAAVTEYIAGHGMGASVRMRAR